MVLRVTVSNVEFLREAVQAVPVGGSAMVLLIWTPEFLGVQSMLTERLGKGENPTTLLKIYPESFASYESTDNHFNVLLESCNLEAIFFVAEDGDPIVFSQSLEDDNGLNNDLGHLRVHFNRPLDVGAEIPTEDFKGDYISFKIYGMLPERTVRYADVSIDPALNPHPPEAIFSSKDFVPFITTMETFGLSSAVIVTVQKKQVFFNAGRRLMEPIIMTNENGLISVRDDVEEGPVRFEFYMQNVDIQPGARLSHTVALFKRSGEVVLMWFRLALLKGDLIYYFY